MNKLRILLSILIIFSFTTNAQQPSIKNTATKQNVLDFLKAVPYGKIISGQQKYPLYTNPVFKESIISKQKPFKKVKDITGKYPGLWGCDFGWAGLYGTQATSIQGIGNRENMVNEAIKRWEEHTLITLMWTMCPPTENEPCCFDDSTDEFVGAQGDLTNDEWDSILISGTTLNTQFINRIDLIVPYLKDLKDANVPILWRPFHEMNAPWFWWGANPEKSKELFIQMYERYVNIHGLDNLIWVWNVDQVEDEEELISYYPGDDYVDVLSMDIYRKTFSPAYHNWLIELASPFNHEKGYRPIKKPIALAEVGGLPVVNNDFNEFLQNQGYWSYFMEWWDYETYNQSPNIDNQNNPSIPNYPKDDFNIYTNPNVINQDGILNIHSNMLINGGFEDPNQNSIWDGLSGHWEIGTSRNYSHSGDNYLKLTGTGDACILSQNISIEYQTEYQFSFWAKCPTNGSRFVVKDNNNVIIADGGYTTVNNQWTLYTLNFNSGYNSIIKVCIEDQGINSHFDDMKFIGEQNFPNLPYLFAQ